MQQRKSHNAQRSTRGEQRAANGRAASNARRAAKQIYADLVKPGFDWSCERVAALCSGLEGRPAARAPDCRSRNRSAAGVPTGRGVPVRSAGSIGQRDRPVDRPVRSANAIGQRGWMLRTGPVSGASASSVPRGPHDPSAQPRGSDQGLLAADTCDAVRCTLARIRSGHPRTGGGLPLTFEGVLGRGIHDTAAWPPSVRGLAAIGSRPSRHRFAAGPDEAGG